MVSGQKPKMDYCRARSESRKPPLESKLGRTRSTTSPGSSVFFRGGEPASSSHEDLYLDKSSSTPFASKCAHHSRKLVLFSRPGMRTAHLASLVAGK